LFPEIILRIFSFDPAFDRDLLKHCVNTDYTQEYDDRKFTDFASISGKFKIDSEAILELKLMN
jgi:hypothetical protein